MTDNQIVPTQNQQPIEKISTYMYRDEVIKRFSDMLGERQAQKFVASVLTAVMADPKLQACSAQSIYLSAVRSATLGLSVDPAYGQAYLVPYGNVCTFMPGYKGFRDKASENGIGCHVTDIYENEKVETNLMTGEVRINGGNGFWRSADNSAGSNGHTVTGYMASWWDVKNPKSGEKHFLYMTIAEIEEYAQTYAPAYNQKSSPWNKNKLSRAEMFKKTVLKRLLRKTAPLNPVVSRLLADLEEEQADVQNDALIQAEQEPKPRRTQAEILGEMGYVVSNPDPADDEDWSNWLALCEKADALGVPHANPVKGSMTADDLTMGFNELMEYVKAAEYQSKAGTEPQ